MVRGSATESRFHNAAAASTRDSCIAKTSHFIAVGVFVAAVAFLSGLVAWERFLTVMTSATGWLIPFGISFLAGTLCGASLRCDFSWSRDLFGSIFWAGEVLAIGTHPRLGDTVQRFVISLAILNLLPLVALMAIGVGSWLRRLTEHDVVSATK